MIKVLISGGGGLLGQYLNIKLSKEFDILTLYHSNPGNCSKFNSQKIDLTNNKSTIDTLNKFKPDVVIHLASISNTALADKLDRSYINQVNIEATKFIADWCGINNTKIIFTSTDLVYKGNFSSMLKENAPVEPLSYYAESKLIGEEKIKELTDNYIILRTSLLYGIPLSNNGCFFKTMYDNLKEGKKVKLFNDQFRTPLSLLEASRIIKELISKDIKEEIINFGGIERISRLKLGEILCEEATLNKSLIESISMDDIDFKYKVKDVSMDTSKLDDLGIKRLDVRESIREIF
ncbi:MAG: NAD(P)-dependent oxidoreductase [Melioribacteraceae bacterium]|nr:NAD(P)-dependent oxidoreductase [Melioribacteraceae bacterium]